MEEILFANPTDQRVFDSSYKGSSNPRQAYRRAYEAQSRRFKAEDQREANTVPGQVRYDNSQGTGIPLTKHRLAEENKREQEQKLRTTYAEFLAFGKFETEPGRDAAARVMTLMGYNLHTVPKDSGKWLLSDEARKRFMGE